MNTLNLKIRPPLRYTACLLLAFCLLCISIVFKGPDANAKPGYVKNGKEYGVVKGSFRHRWWNYYERALSFADGDFLKEAEEDLKTSLKERGKDQRMARTYGMHFVDYFPHRELGIVYYKRGDLERARQELELSISQFPSAKASFYLDRVRRDMIAATGRDVFPPGLEVDNDEEIWTSEGSLTFSGKAEDDTYVASIMINGKPLLLESAQKQISFQKEISLSQGNHEIEIRAVNLMGKHRSRVFKVHVDSQGPMIAVEDIIRDSAAGSGVILAGSVFDDSGVAEIQVNGRRVDGQNQQDLEFSERIPGDLNAVELVATDRLGNRTVARIDLKTPSAQSRPIRLASLDPVVNKIILAEAMAPEQEPFIKINDWTDKQTVFFDKIYLEGEVSFTGKITGLSVNREPILRKKGMKIFFNHLAELQEGENVFVIEALSESGIKSSRTITVNRRIPRAFHMEERMSMTVLPFEQLGDDLSFSMVSIQDNLINGLLEQNRFRVIEREKLDVILQEQKLSQTGLVDRKTALRLGRLAAAQAILTGSVVENSSGIEIVARLVDTETSEILATEDVYGEMKDIKGLRLITRGLATKFHHEFPLLDGQVVRIMSKSIFIDIGSDLLKLQRRLIVYREEQIKHPVTGKVLGSDNVIIGHARVTQVIADLAKAELTGDLSEKIQPLHRVITQ